jgi:hypothetical protein
MTSNIYKLVSIRGSATETGAKSKEFVKLRKNIIACAQLYRSLQLHFSWPIGSNIGPEVAARTRPHLTKASRRRPCVGSNLSVSCCIVRLLVISERDYFRRHSGKNYEAYINVNLKQK